MKKLISFMLSLTCLLCAVSCGKKPEEDITPEQLESSSQESSSQAEEILAEDIHSYKSEKIELTAFCFAVFLHVPKFIHQ